MSPKTKKILLIGGGAALVGILYMRSRSSNSAPQAFVAAKPGTFKVARALSGGSLGDSNMLSSEMGSLGCCGK